MIDDTLTLTDTLISTVAGGSPPVHAVDLDYAKLHIRALNSVDNLLVHTFIDAAAAYFEGDTTRQLLTAVREVWLDAFPALGASGAAARIELPHPPLQAVLSVSYVDAAGASWTMGGSPSGFVVVAPQGPYAVRGSVEPVGSWPSAGPQSGAVRIRYRCGYGDTPDQMPALVREALGMLIANADTFRSAVHEARRGQTVELPYGVRAMLDNFKYTAKSSQRLRRQAAGGGAGMYL